MAKKRKRADDHEADEHEELSQHPDDDEAVAALLKNFAANAPHPEASMHGRYTFQSGDAWSQEELNADDGWYTDGAWSVLIRDGSPKEAVRADVDKPEDAHRVSVSGDD